MKSLKIFLVEFSFLYLTCCSCNNAFWVEGKGDVGDGNATDQTEDALKGDVLEDVEDEEMLPVINTDLDTTFIERTPRYRRYCLNYVDNLPLLCTGTEGEKLAPETGEPANFIAHIINKGAADSGQFNFSWYVDGNLIMSGSHGNIPPGGEGTETMQWSWQSGTHSVKFRIDMSDDHPRNNELEDKTDALYYRFHVEPSVYDEFNSRINVVGTYSFEDWIQEHIKQMNTLFSGSGSLESVRVDQIVIEDNLPPVGEHAPEDMEWDGRWGFDNAEWTVSKIATEITSVQMTLVHELTHQLGLIDSYNLNYDWNYIRDNHVVPECGTCDTSDPTACRRCMYYNENLKGIMNGAYERGYSPFEAKALNSNLHKRRGFYGDYLYDIPSSNSVVFLDVHGAPLGNASINVYQAVSNTIPNEPVHIGSTDGAGVYNLPNIPVASFTTATGHTLRDNPFGKIFVWGGNGIFLFKIQARSQEDFQYMDISTFNLQYWAGNTYNATHEISTVIDILPANGCQPSQEICDGIDNDCDGSADEGDVCGGECNDTGLQNPVVDSPDENQTFPIECPANNNNYDCIIAYANNWGVACPWSHWSGNNAVFSCAGLPAGNYTARCVAVDETSDDCCSASTTLSYAVQSGSAGCENIDLLDYCLPSGATTNRMSSGEYFFTYDATIRGRPGFYTVKSMDTRYFEEFYYDNDYIYHLRDTTWATADGGVKCNGTNNEAYFTLLNGDFGGSPCDAFNQHGDLEGSKWIPRRMSVGESSPYLPATVVGFDKNTCSCCDTPYTGAGGGHTMRLVSCGHRSFNTGWSGNHVIRLVVVNGAGKGENYYYARGIGWVGFEWRSSDDPINGNIVWGNYIIEVLTEQHFRNDHCHP